MFFFSFIRAFSISVVFISIFNILFEFSFFLFNNFSFLRSLLLSVLFSLLLLFIFFRSLYFYFLFIHVCVCVCICVYVCMRLSVLVFLSRFIPFPFILVTFIFLYMAPSVDLLQCLFFDLCYFPFHTRLLPTSYINDRCSKMAEKKTWQPFALEPDNFACDFRFQLRSVSDKSGDLYWRNQSHPLTESLSCSLFLLNVFFFRFIFFNSFLSQTIFAITLRDLSTDMARNVKNVTWGSIISREMQL